MTTPATTSQTVGPYFAIGLAYRNAVAVCGEDVAGRRIKVAGQVIDGGGVPIPDAQLELWQADASGNYAGLHAPQDGLSQAGFSGFARVPVDASGAFHFDTVYPGATPFGDGRQQAPHIVVLLSMRGLLKHLYTRIYFSGEAANAVDPVLMAVPADRRHTLCARPGESADAFVWNVYLQGDEETVFFDY